MFSFLYLPMLLILFSLIARGAAMELRGKHDAPRWRSVWDWVLAISSFTAPLVLGLGFGNIFRGLAFDMDGYKGSFFGLFNPYGLLTALVFVLLFLQHGALWLRFKTDGDLGERAGKLAGILWFLVLIAAAGFLVMTGFATRLYENYLARPFWFVVPLLAVLALVGVLILRTGGRPLGAFAASCATIVLVIATGLVGLFPNLIPSRLDTAASLTIFNSSSGPYTLKLMSIVAAIFIPIVIVYQFLVFRFFRGKVTRKAVAQEADGY
jgi:cytochrome d ubiquinol oxidase subunit II